MGEEFPVALELRPSDLFVADISLLPGEWDLPWAEIGSRRVRMRAIYEVEATEAARKHGVWTGKIASGYGIYTIADNRR